MAQGPTFKEKPLIAIVSRDSASRREKKTFTWKEYINNSDSSLLPGAKLILWEDGAIDWSAASQGKKPRKESHVFFEFHSPAGKRLFFMPGGGADSADDSYPLMMESANTAYNWKETWKYDRQFYLNTHACVMHHFSK
jgi:hypothetical protein